MRFLLLSQLQFVFFEVRNLTNLTWFYLAETNQNLIVKLLELIRVHKVKPDCVEFLLKAHRNDEVKFDLSLHAG